jgi:hypothetical protein
VPVKASCGADETWIVHFRTAFLGFPLDAATKFSAHEKRLNWQVNGAGLRVELVRFWRPGWKSNAQTVLVLLSFAVKSSQNQ